jgi:hypothetical protein
MRDFYTPPDAVGELIFQAQREMAFVLKRSRHLAIRQQHPSWAYLRLLYYFREAALVSLWSSPSCRA